MGELSIAFVLAVMVLIAVYMPQFQFNHDEFADGTIFMGAIIAGVVVSVLYGMIGAIREHRARTDR